MTDKTLIILKPDAVKRKLTGEIISRIEQKDLVITKMELRNLSADTLAEHYAEHTEKPFYGELVQFMTSGPAVVMEVTGRDVVSVMRTLIGATDPASAAPGTIRGDYGILFTENLVHGSDSDESAERELKIWFS